MKFWIKLVFKTLAGGLGGFILFSLATGLIDIFSHLVHRESCDFLLYAPIFFLVNLVFGSGLDDWAILSFLVGAGFVFISQIRPLLTVYFPEQANRIIRILIAVSLALASIGIGLNVQKYYVIKKMYFEFCQAYNAQDYELAYSYFSPEYRSEVGLRRFTKTLYRPYVDPCNEEFEGTILHRFNGAVMYPYSWSYTVCDFVAGPELILVRIDGKWYFTGEYHWYVG